MCRKLNTEVLQKEAEQYGFTLLEEHVENKKLSIMCHRGHIQQQYPYYFKSAKCEECNKIDKAISVRQEVEGMGYILHNEYKNIETILIATCPNGHERKCKISSLRTYDCKACTMERKLYELMDRIEDRGYRIISIPKDTRGVMKAICKNGHVREAKAYNFINHDCIECKTGRPLKYDFDFCKDIFESKNFILLETEYIDCKTMMKYICTCGEHNETTLDILLNTDIVGCYKCKGVRTSGENHYNWKGGLSSEHSRIRSSGKYLNWRKAVFERDNYTCQCCGDNQTTLNAHHIENFSEKEDKRFDVENGITLCENCHGMTIKGSFHHVYGTKNNTREQLDEYLSNYQYYQSLYER